MCFKGESPFRLCRQFVTQFDGPLYKGIFPDICYFFPGPNLHFFIISYQSSKQMASGSFQLYNSKRRSHWKQLYLLQDMRCLPVGYWLYWVWWKSVSFSIRIWRRENTENQADTHTHTHYIDFKMSVFFYLRQKVRWTLSNNITACSLQIPVDCMGNMDQSPANTVCTEFISWRCMGKYWI
jgi:hypothetical protein